MEASRPVTHLNLKLLQTFLVVAEHGSFRTAAMRTHRSISAVSTQIKELEKQMGVTLFHRTTRSIALTPQGQELFQGARRGFQEITLSLRRIEDTLSSRRAHVALACSPSVASARLPLILSVFEREYREVRVTLQEMPAGLNEVVREGTVDFGVGPVVDGYGDLDFEPILDDPLMALVPRGYVSADQDSITLEELASIPMLLSSTATAMRQLLEEALRARSLQLHMKYQASQVQTLVAMAEAGLGAAILPRSVSKTSRSDAVRALPIVEPVLVRQIALITSRGATLSPAAAGLAQLIRALIDEDLAGVPANRPTGHGVAPRAARSRRAKT